MIGASYFGRKPTKGYDHRDGQQLRTLRALFLIVFLSGNLVFVFYRASLTAELSVRRTKPPFSTLDEFLDSDYK
jgi:membrane-anchored protein YejM (alkaline phosphatase superfamily)